jgi:hypothetical protein
MIKQKRYAQIFFFVLGTALYCLMVSLPSIWRAAHQDTWKSSVFALFLILLLPIFHLPALWMGHSISASKRLPISDDLLPANWRRRELWRSPTDLRFIERRKVKLLEEESTAIQLIREDILIDQCRAENERVEMLQEQWKKTLVFVRPPKPPELPFGMWSLIFARKVIAVLSDSSVIDRSAALRDEIDRLYRGQTRSYIDELQVSLQKLKRRRSDCSKETSLGKMRALELDEQIIELEQELREVERFTADYEAGKRPDPQGLQYAGDVHKNYYAIRQDIFKSFESYVLKDVETRKAYNEWRARVADDPSLSAQQKQELNALIEERFSQHNARDTTKKTSRPQIFEAD